MALNWLKNWLLDRANSNFAQLTTHSDTRSVGVLLDHAEPELQDSILRYFEKKGVPNDQVILLFFFSQKPVEEPSCLHYHSKDIKWAGYALNDHIRSFLSHDFNRLYYLCDGFDAHQQLILKHCKAAFKTGIYQSGVEPFLDLTIDDHPGNALAQIQVIDSWIDKKTSHGK